MKLRRNLPIKIIIQEFDDIYMWKMYKDKWIKHYEELDTYHIKCSPQLFALWSNKALWLEDAIHHNYFNTQYFQYTDFGSFRYDNLSEDIINNYPVIDKYEDDKIIISLLDNFKEEDMYCIKPIEGELLIHSPDMWHAVSVHNSDLPRNVFVFDIDYV
jgi:hypothetical protein